MTEKPNSPENDAFADEQFVDDIPAGQVDPDAIAAAQAAAEQRASEQAGGASPDDSPAAVLSILQQERDELEQRLLRVSADYQNYTRRAEQNTRQAEQQKLMAVARAVAPAMDHFDRALDVDPETTSAADLLQGVQSIQNELLKALAAVGVSRVDVQPGDAFDPVRHEALTHMPHDDIASGDIVQQCQPGYAVGETVVRPAQVILAQ
ncbi:MAG: nucleotide exchange factor GrpE [Planctomycetota bacterium]